MAQKFVKLRKSPILKEQFHGITGVVTEERTVCPAGMTAEPCWTMFHVTLDEPVETNGVDGYIKHTGVCLPSTMFQEITEEEYGISSTRNI